MKVDVDQLAEQWIAEKLAQSNSATDQADKTEDESAADIALHLPYEAPNVAWAFVDCVFAKTTSTPVLALIGAGVLEELIAADHANAVPELKRLISRYPVVAEVLHGVWKGDIPDATWREIMSLRSNK